MSFSQQQQKSARDKPAKLKGLTPLNPAASRQAGLDTSSLSLLADVALVGRHNNSNRASAVQGVCRAGQFCRKSSSLTEEPKKQMEDYEPVGDHQRQTAEIKTGPENNVLTHIDHSYHAVTESYTCNKGVTYKNNGEGLASPSNRRKKFISCRNPSNQVITHTNIDRNVVSSINKGSQGAVCSRPYTSLLLHNYSVRQGPTESKTEEEVSQKGTEEKLVSPRKVSSLGDISPKTELLQQENQKLTEPVVNPLPQIEHVNGLSLDHCQLVKCPGKTIDQVHSKIETFSKEASLNKASNQLATKSGSISTGDLSKISGLIGPKSVPEEWMEPPIVRSDSVATKPDIDEGLQSTKRASQQLVIKTDTGKEIQSPTRASDQAVTRTCQQVTETDTGKGRDSPTRASDQAVNKTDIVGGMQSSTSASDLAVTKTCQGVTETDTGKGMDSPTRASDQAVNKTDIVGGMQSSTSASELAVTTTCQGVTEADTGKGMQSPTRTFQGDTKTDLGKGIKSLRKSYHQMDIENSGVKDICKNVGHSRRTSDRMVTKKCKEMKVVTKKDAGKKVETPQMIKERVVTKIVSSKPTEPPSVDKVIKTDNCKILLSPSRTSSRLMAKKNTGGKSATKGEHIDQLTTSIDLEDKVVTPRKRRNRKVNISPDYNLVTCQRTTSNIVPENTLIKLVDKQNKASSSPVLRGTCGNQITVTGTDKHTVNSRKITCKMQLTSGKDSVKVGKQRSKRMNIREKTATPNYPRKKVNDNNQVDPKQPVNTSVGNDKVIGTLYSNSPVDFKDLDPKNNITLDMSVSIETDPVATVTDPVAMVTGPVAIVTDPVAMVTDPVAMVTDPVAIVADPVAMVTDPAMEEDSFPVVTNLIYVNPSSSNENGETPCSEAVKIEPDLMEGDQKESENRFSPQIVSYGTIISSEEWALEPYPVELVFNNDLVKTEPEDNQFEVPHESVSQIPTETFSQVPMDTVTQFSRDDLSDVSVILNPDFLLEELNLPTRNVEDEKIVCSTKISTPKIYIDKMLDTPEKAKPLINDKTLDSALNLAPCATNDEISENCVTKPNYDLLKTIDSTGTLRILTENFKIIQCSVMLDRLPENVHQGNVPEMLEGWKDSLSVHRRSSTRQSLVCDEQVIDDSTSTDRHWTDTLLAALGRPCLKEEEEVVVKQQKRSCQPEDVQTSVECSKPFKLMFAKFKEKCKKDKTYPREITELQTQQSVTKGNGGEQTRKIKDSSGQLRLNQSEILSEDTIYKDRSETTCLSPSLSNVANGRQNQNSNIDNHQRLNNDYPQGDRQAVCENIFTSSGDLTGHHETHSKVKSHTCSICDKVFSRLDNLQVHSRTHKGERPYKCTVCGKGFIQFGTWSNHMLTHSKDKQFKCAICRMEFAVKYALVRHQLKHTDKRPYKCTVCGKGFKAREYVNLHERSHTKVQPYSCDVCYKRFTRPSSVTVHMRTHTKERPYTCAICGKGFTTGAVLKTHQVTHTKEKAYKCGVCGQRFAHKWNLTSHTLKHTGEKPHPCHECGKDFRTAGDLAQHRRSHSGEKPYKCTLCGKGFGSKGNLASHRRIHSGVKPYKCTVCEKCFTESSQLAQHSRIHTGERPHACTVCGKGFTQKAHVTKHQRTHLQ